MLSRGKPILILGPKPPPDASIQDEENKLAQHLANKRGKKVFAGYGWEKNSRQGKPLRHLKLVYPVISTCHTDFPPSF